MPLQLTLTGLNIVTGYFKEISVNYHLFLDSRLRGNDIIYKFIWF
jgi:hypothetical protein